MLMLCGRSMLCLRNAAQLFFIIALLRSLSRHFPSQSPPPLWNFNITDTLYSYWVELSFGGPQIIVISKVFFFFFLPLKSKASLSWEWSLTPENQQFKKKKWQQVWLELGGQKEKDRRQGHRVNNGFISGPQSVFPTHQRLLEMQSGAQSSVLAEPSGSLWCILKSGKHGAMSFTSLWAVVRSMGFILNEGEGYRRLFGVGETWPGDTYKRKIWLLWDYGDEWQNGRKRDKFSGSHLWHGDTTETNFIKL